jgi:hypothetical protein
LSASDHPAAGLIITVAGPDGSGKTSFCDALLAGALRDENVRRIHHRFALLPVRGGNTSDPSQPHAEPPYARGVSEAKVLALFGEWLIGMLRARPFVRSGGFLIIERGWWDLAVDPARYRLQPNLALVRMLGRLLPRADLLIILEGPAELLAARKNEVSVEELARQRSVWREIVPRRQRTLYIDVSRPLSDVVSRATDEVSLLAPSRIRRMR